MLPKHLENKPIFIVLTNSSSMLVWHFSRFILFMATRSCLGVQRAACTTAVAPLPGITDTTEQWRSGPEQRGTHSTQLEDNSYIQHHSVALWYVSGLVFLRFCVYVMVFILHVCYISWLWVFFFNVMACLLGSLQIRPRWSSSSEVVHTKKLWHTAYCFPTVSDR